MSATPADVFAVIGLAPALPGARCRGRGHLFDPADQHESSKTVTERHAQAMGLCGHCPALAACRQWVTDLPERQRPAGVTAGTVRMRDPNTGRTVDVPKGVQCVDTPASAPIGPRRVGTDQ